MVQQTNTWHHAGCKCRRLYSIVADFALPSSFLEGSNRCGSTREFTFTDRRAATVSCAKSARCSVQILFTIENTRSESALLCGKRLGAISASHSFTQSGLKWALYDFFFFLAFEFPAHGDPLGRDAIAVFCPLH